MHCPVSTIGMMEPRVTVPDCIILQVCWWMSALALKATQISPLGPLFDSIEDLSMIHTSLIQRTCGLVFILLKLLYDLVSVSNSASFVMYYLHYFYSLSGSLNIDLKVLEELSKMDEETKGKELDAGSLFVLESKGTWLHAVYHLTTAIVGPAILSLPYAFANLGWIWSIVAMVLGSAVTFYGYNIISRLLEDSEKRGCRHLRFRDLTTDILGPIWSLYLVVPIQFIVSAAVVVAVPLVCGQSIEIIYLRLNANGEIKLYDFILISGGILSILAQLPSFHSLRHMNLISLLLSLGYSLAIVCSSIYAGFSKHAPAKEYSLIGSTINRIFNASNGLAIIATSFGTSIIAEIQATISPPTFGKMLKGLLVCYAIIVCTFFSVSISGYWAFGNQAGGNIFNNFAPHGAPSLIPNWLLILGILCVILQLFPIGLVYAQPLFEVMEGKLSNPKRGIFSARNLIPRIIVRTTYIIISSFFAAMLPFFGDLNAFIGAIGFIPLGFIIPILLYLVAYKPPIWTLDFWVHVTILVVYTIVGLISVVSSIRQIVLDAHDYKLFANSTN